MEDQKEKESQLFKFLGFIFSFSFPFFKLLGMNTYLKRCYRIVDNQQWKNFFKKQIRYNYFLSSIVTLPSIVMITYAFHIVDQDAMLKKRYHELSRSVSFYEIPFQIKKIYKIQKEDSSSVIEDKRETQRRFLAFSILLGFSIVYSTAFSIMILYLHPTFVDNKKLKKILLNQGVIERDEADKAIVFSTPIGFLIDVGTTPAREIADSKRIWPKMNIKVKQWYEDPDERSIVFFEKAYELKPMYNYEKI